MRVTFLGTGTSHGIPSIGCTCAVCCSPDPRDRRSRCAIHVRWRGQELLVDTPPELRQQAIRSHVRRVEAILYTHSHADHLFGLDDVRRYNDLQGGELPVYARADVLSDLEQCYSYVFRVTQAGGGKPRLRLVEIDGPTLRHAGLEIQAIPVLHGRLPVTAFRFGPFAYVTDVSKIPDSSMARLRDLHTLVLGALRHEPHATHFTVAQALAVVEQLAPQRAFFVHMAHGLGHRATNTALPTHVRLAYDGLIIDVPED